MINRSLISNSKKKKGNAVLETMVILIVLLAFGLIIMVGYKAFGDINTEMQSDPDLSNQSKQIMTDTDTSYPSMFDNMVAFILFVLTIAAIIFAYTIDTNPVFFVITIILLIIMMVVGALIANPFQEVSADLGVEDSFPITKWLFNHLLTVIIVQSMFITIALYANSRAG